MPGVLGAGNEKIELYAKENLLLDRQAATQVASPGAEVLGLLERFKVDAAQLRVNGLRIIIPHEPQAGVDLLLHDGAIDLGEPGKYLHEHRQHGVAR